MPHFGLFLVGGVSAVGVAVSSIVIRGLICKIKRSKKVQMDYEQPLLTSSSEAKIDEAWDKTRNLGQDESLAFFEPNLGFVVEKHQLPNSQQFEELAQKYTSDERTHAPSGSYEEFLLPLKPQRADEEESSNCSDDETETCSLADDELNNEEFLRDINDFTHREGDLGKTGVCELGNIAQPKKSLNLEIEQMPAIVLPQTNYTEQEPYNSPTFGQEKQSETKVKDEAESEDFEVSFRAATVTWPDGTQAADDKSTVEEEEWADNDESRQFAEMDDEVSNSSPRDIERGAISTSTLQDTDLGENVANVPSTLLPILQPAMSIEKVHTRVSARIEPIGHNNGLEDVVTETPIGSRPIIIESEDEGTDDKAVSKTADVEIPTAAKPIDSSMFVVRKPEPFNAKSTNTGNARNEDDEKENNTGARRAEAAGSGANKGISGSGKASILRRTNRTNTKRFRFAMIKALPLRAGRGNK